MRHTCLKRSTWVRASWIAHHPSPYSRLDPPTIRAGDRLEDAFRDSLPDMTESLLSEQVQLGPHTLLIQVSPIRHYDDYGPDVDVVHVWALRPDATILTLRDVRSNASRQAAYDLWSLLCDQLSAAATLVYGLKPNDDGTPNPRLGCWGPRPDLAGTDADDAATALVMGVAVDTRAAAQPARPELLALALRSAVVASLRRWIAEAEPRRTPNPRLN